MNTRDDLPPGFPVDPEDTTPEFDIPEPPEPDRRVTIGQVVKAHGLKGDLKVQPLTWRPERFAELDRVWLESVDGRIHWLTPKRVRIEPGAVYLRFMEAPVREFVEPLINGRLFIDQADRDELPDDLYYVDDLVGCRVTCTVNGDLGTINDVMDLPANDVWQVDGPHGEVLIPAIHDVIDEIDIDKKQIRVTLPEGLLPEEQDKADPEVRGSGRSSSRSRHRIQRPERREEKPEPPDDH